MLKANDMEYLKNAHDTIFKSGAPEEEKDEAWNRFYKTTCLEDLMSTITPLSHGEPVAYYRGNVLADTAIVVEKFNEDANEIICFLKKIFLKMSIDYNEFYVTSFFKSPTFNFKTSSDVLNSELKLITPKTVVVFTGSYNQHYYESDTAKVYEINIQLVKKYNALAGLGELTEDEAAEFTDIKKQIWSVIVNIIQ